MPIFDHIMLRRGAMIAALWLVTGCSEEMSSGGATASREASGDIENDGLACALDGATEFTRNCDLERIDINGEKELVFRHPDGGFRRFMIVSDGRGLVTSDGAIAAEVALQADNQIIVTVGDDRYQLPATLTSGAGANSEDVEAGDAPQS